MPLLFAAGSVYWHSTQIIKPVEETCSIIGLTVKQGVESKPSLQGYHLSIDIRYAFCVVPFDVHTAADYSHFAVSGSDKHSTPSSLDMLRLGRALSFGSYSIAWLLHAMQDHLQLPPLSSYGVLQEFL